MAFEQLPHGKHQLFKLVVCFFSGAVVLRAHKSAGLLILNQLEKLFSVYALAAKANEDDRTDVGVSCDPEQNSLYTLNFIGKYNTAGRVGNGHHVSELAFDIGDDLICAHCGREDCNVISEANEAVLPPVSIQLRRVAELETVVQLDKVLRVKFVKIVFLPVRYGVAQIVSMYIIARFNVTDSCTY